jgi:uncharacterized protein with ATP-grasp and redox domains
MRAKAGFKESRFSRLTGIASDCHACVLDQVRSAARYAELNREQTRRLISMTRDMLAEADQQSILVQHIIRQVADAIIKVRGESTDFDIYADVKTASNALSLACADSLQEQIGGSPSRFETGLQIAAAGNIIDFGAKDHKDLDVEKELGNLTEIPFGRYDIEPLKKILTDAGTLLYILDNSGEIVFDMLFIKEIQRFNPGLQVTAALRDKPIINDATLEDAHQVGLDQVVTALSSGSVYPGTVLPETTDEFRRLFDTADVVIAKGQGNLETLLPYADSRLFFLLRIKCDYMAALTGVDKNSLVLMQGGEGD